MGIGATTQYRVNGNLNLSRTIGDLAYKQNANLTPAEQMISATPDIRAYNRRKDDEFIVLACDGVWDVCSSQEVVDFIRSRLGDPTTLEPRLRDGTVKLSTILGD